MPTATAAAQRAAAKFEYNAFLAVCPSRRLLDALADKWVCLIIAALADGPRRYNDLGRDIAGVSQKMLTQTLRTLERNGLVERTVTPTVPVRVDYELTRLGTSLLPVTKAIKDWAEAHMDEVEQAQRAYDGDGARAKGENR